jgi:hypothetical protein
MVKGKMKLFPNVSRATWVNSDVRETETDSIETPGVVYIVERCDVVVVVVREQRGERRTQRGLVRVW